MPELQALTRPLQAADLGAAWLLTYLLHSTLLLGGAWLATRGLGRLTSARRPLLSVQQTVWRAALLGGLVTATLQLGLGWQPPLGSWQLGGGNAEDRVVEEGIPTETTGAVGQLMAATPEAVAPESSSPDRSQPPSAIPVGTSSELPASTSTGSAPTRSGLRVPGADPTLPALGASSPSFSSAFWSASLPFLRWTVLITGLWLLGAFVLAGSLALSYRSFCRRIRNRSRVVGGDVRRLFDGLEPDRAVGRPVALSASSRVQSPLAKGVTRPEVCLPLRVLSELSARQQKSLLAHELGHLVRRDPLWLLVARTVEGVLFFQPLNGLARRRLQEISELRADDWAVRATGSPLDLARCLTRVADWNLTPVPVPSMAERSGSGLTRRIHRLLQSPEVEGDDGSPRGLWLAAVALLLAVALAAPGVSAVAGDSEPPPPPESPEAPEAPEVTEAPEAPPAPPAGLPSLAVPGPDAPSAPVVAPTPPNPAPLPSPSPSPKVAPAPAPAPGVTPPPRRPSFERPVLSRPPFSRPPRIAPVPSVPTPSAPSAHPPRLAWMASPPAPAPRPAPFPATADGEDRETTSPRHRSEELTRQELAAVMEEALEPLETVHEDIEELIEAELGTEMEALEIQLETLDENLEIELEALEELEDEELLDLSNAEVAELNAHVRAMNAAILAEMEPLLELERSLPIPRVEHLAQAAARRAEQLAEEARRLARGGVSEAEAARLREQARRLAREMEPQREEIERLQEQARSLAREARERVNRDTRALRERLREQQREQMEELRSRLEALREEREDERQRRREELRDRLETQRRQLEQQREQLRQRLERERDQRREQMDEQRLEMEERERRIEEHRLQMEEHRRELERQRQREANDEEGDAEEG